MIKILIYIEGILLIVLISLVVFGLIPAQFRLYTTTNKINTNTELRLKCEIVALDYDYWWESPECKEYEEYHKEYEEWLIKN